MTEQNGSNNGGDSLLDRAVAVVRSQPTCEESLRQTLAGLHSQASARHQPRRRLRGLLTRRWLITSGVAATLVAAAAAWLWRPTASWAEVAEALRGKPWIHATSRQPSGPAGEFWLSFERDVYADRRGKWAMFDDSRLQARYEYDPEKQEIVRTVVPDKDAARSSAELFDGIRRGQVRVGLIFSGRQVVSQEKRRVVEAGREWLDYDLTLRVAYDLASNRLARMRFRVDPESHLPHSLTAWESAPTEESTEKPHQIEFLFDYPDDGPCDIYDLGVPRTAKFTDRVPSTDLSRLFAAVESGRNRFDSYSAIVVQQIKDRPWHEGTPTLVWRKGNRWRAEIGAFNRLPPKPDVAVDRLEWWKDALASCTFLPIEVCDGETVYRVRFDPPDANGKQAHRWEAVRTIEASQALERAGQAAHNMPELFAYPITLQAPANVFTVELEPHPADGPADSLLVRYVATDALKEDRAFRDCRYWVDPAKGYVTRRYVLANGQNSDGSATTDTYTMEELERSPRGIWYPTLVRRKVTQVPPPDAPNYVGETVTRFFLDFDAQIPDDLFRPADREIQ